MLVDDTNSGVNFPYNYAEPKIHREGLNVGMCDGSAQWINFAIEIPPKDFRIVEVLTVPP